MYKQQISFWLQEKSFYIAFYDKVSDTQSQICHTQLQVY